MGALLGVWTVSGASRQKSRSNGTQIRLRLGSSDNSRPTSKVPSIWPCAFFLKVPFSTSTKKDALFSLAPSHLVFCGSLHLTHKKFELIAGDLRAAQFSWKSTGHLSQGTLYLKVLDALGKLPSGHTARLIYCEDLSFVE